MGASIEELFRAHWPLVYRYLERRTGDAATAEDLAQETFFRATRAFLGWRGGSPAAWLLAIARHVLADAALRGRPLVPLPETLADPRAGDDTRPPVETVLARLPPRQRRLLELVYVHGFSHAEVAAMSGTTAAAVKTAVWRAREAFRAVYEEEVDDE